jgi:flagellar basal body-associated protein FliL
MFFKIQNLQLKKKGSIMTTFAIFIFVVLIGVILYFMFMNFSYSSKLDHSESSAFNEKLTSIFNSLLGNKKDLLPSTSADVKRKKTLECMNVEVVSGSYNLEKGLILDLTTTFDNTNATLVLNLKDARSVEIKDKIPIIFTDKKVRVDTSLLENNSKFKNLKKPLEVQINIDGCRVYSFFNIK